MAVWMHSSWWTVKFLLTGKNRCNFWCILAKMPSYEKSLSCFELEENKEPAGPGPETCVKFWPIWAELCCRRSGVRRQSPEEMRLTSEHRDSVSAQVGLDKEFVIAIMYQKWYVNVEKWTDDFSPGESSDVPCCSCCRKSICVLQVVVLRTCCLTTQFRGRSWPVERAIVGLLASAWDFSSNKNIMEEN